MCVYVYTYFFAGHGKGNSGVSGNKCAARSFTFRELAAATRGFREVNLIGEGGFGRVFKGRLETNQVKKKKKRGLFPTFVELYYCLL